MLACNTSQNRFSAVIVDSCKSKSLFPKMTQGFCAYTVLTSLPVWTFPVRGQLGLTLPRSTLFGVSQNCGVCTHTLSHTQLCVEQGPLFLCRFLLPKMQLCITANVLKWPHSSLSFPSRACTHTYAFISSHQFLSILGGSFVISVGSGQRECPGEKWGTGKGQLNTITLAQHFINSLV